MGGQAEAFKGKTLFTGLLFAFGKLFGPVGGGNLRFA